jgi:DNA-directed RNA polymerase specialized sigma subunit
MPESPRPAGNRPHHFPANLDLLPTMPVSESFSCRIRQLCLSRHLEEKALRQCEVTPPTPGSPSLTEAEEKELATEVLLLRHRFTEQLSQSRNFRQAALTVLQNIYLFQQRRIFFAPNSGHPDQERQEALGIFSTLPPHRSLPLAKTLQHLIISRVWQRICSQLTPEETLQENFLALHRLVVKLNTIRNIYMMLTRGLIHRLAGGIRHRLGVEAVSHADAVQMGSIGIGRAAYRYHHSCGVRFSTFAAPYVFKEIDRQVLAGRLIRLPGCVARDWENSAPFVSPTLLVAPEGIPEQRVADFAAKLEKDETRTALFASIDQVLTKASGDIVKRRYGLPPYQGQPQSVLSISRLYGVTRSSIYQREQTALKRLKKHLQSKQTLFSCP